MIYYALVRPIEGMNAIFEKWQLEIKENYNFARRAGPEGSARP